MTDELTLKTKETAKKLNCQEEVLVITKVTTMYGDEKAMVLIYKYDSKDALEKIEPAYLMKKHKPKEAKGEKKETEEGKEA